MGNSIQKKRGKEVQMEKNSSSPLSLSPNLKWEKPTSFWLLGRPDKLRTAGPKGNEDQKRLAVHYTASQHHQENVFIQGTRPQYLEDLHTEAQEGLKIQQQEDHKNGGTFADDESIASTDSLCPEQHISSKDRDSSLESRSTGTPDTTVTSAVSTEPALTRQGSTFKPLNPVKRTDRSRRRNRRTTIMGIPNQVQKELALHRGSTFQPLVSTQLPDHDKPDSQSSVVIIPTVDGGTPVANKEGARVHLSELEVFRDEALVREHLQGVYQNQKSYLCPTSYLRPKSVAVPGITTSFSLSSSMQEPQGPVMSISPQATYMSTIIPNAILPASVEVIEIDHSISRTRGGSVNHDGGACTISKNSLTHGDSAVSPLLSRRSEGDGSQTNSSNYYTTLMEPNWSQSQSSKTVSSNKAGLNLQGSKVEQSKDQVLASLQSSVSATSSPSSKAEDATDSSSDCGATNAMTAGEQIKNKRSATHSLSVMKTKQPPAPPQRTNSLHSNKIRGDSKTVETKDVSNSGSKEEAEDITRLVVTNISTTLTPLSKSSLGEPSLQDSSKHNRKAIEPPLESSTSSPQKNPPEGEHFERTMSPSSGYSSQSGTPTLSPKGISSASPDQQKNTPRKPERSASRASSSAASPSSSLTSLSSDTSELANSSVSTCSTTLLQQRSSPPVTTEELPPVNEPSSFRVSVRELFNIPPPPKVKAPCPPPPETWAHNKRTVELLCRTCTNREVPQKPTQIQDRTEEQTEIQMKPRDDLQIKEEKQTATEECVQETSGKNTKLVAFSPMESQSGDVEQEIRERSGPQQVQEEEKTDVQREERNTSEDKEPEIQATTPKKNPPPVMKKPPRLLFMEDEEQLLEADTEGTEVHVSVEKHKESSHNTVSIVVQERDEVPSMQMLSVEGPKTHKLSPPPTPPPAYQPTPPLMKKTSSTAECVAPKEPQREQEDPCWPPPPPPMEGDSVFDGGEEVDFPPPPPPSITDSVLEVTDVGVSRAETADEAAWKPVQNISCIADSVSLPSVEPSPVSPRAESPVSVTAVVLPSSVLKQNPLKSEEPSPSAHPESAQLSAPGTLLTAETSTQGFPFRRLSSGGFRDTRSKELLPRHKVPPNPKEDANIPLVTPSLLQMVRLRSVSMNEDQVKAASEDKSINLEALVQENCPVSIQGPQNIPQKPIRKSLSLKSSTQTLQTSVVTTNSPSTCLQEVIRMKTAAMSSRDGLTPRLGVKPPAYSCTSEPGALKSHEEMHRSTASTASFIFSRSTKKVVIETVAASSSEAQASLKQNLAAELRQVSDQSKPGAYANGGLKCDKVPPPVAKKPAHGSMSPSQRSHGPSVKVELHTERNGTRGGVQYPSRVAPPETTTRVTVDTIETLF